MLYRLTESHVPVLIPGNYSRLTWIGVSLGGTPRVDISVAAGLGGLPDAHVTFDARELRINGGAGHSFERKAAKRVSLLFEIGNTAFGTESINELVRDQVVWKEGYTCGHGYRSNENEIRNLTRHAQALAEVSGFELSAISEQVIN